MACADIIPERAEAKAEQYGIKALSVQELLADPEIEKLQENLDRDYNDSVRDYYDQKLETYEQKLMQASRLHSFVRGQDRQAVN